VAWFSGIFAGMFLSSAMGFQMSRPRTTGVLCSVHHATCLLNTGAVLPR
jgi:hypothetical protein